LRYIDILRPDEIYNLSGLTSVSLSFEKPAEALESIVFDLGGHRGDFAYEINRQYNSIVYVFEPNKQYYDH
jgi:hypothetical protein